MKSYPLHFRSLYQAAVVAALSLGLSACSMFDFLGLGGDEEANPPEELGVVFEDGEKTSSEPKDVNPDGSKPVEIEEQPEEFVAPPVEVESKDSEAMRLLDSIRVAKKASDGETIYRELIKLRDLGPDQYPTLFIAYGEVFDLPSDALITHREYRRRQSSLGIAEMRDFVTGPLYTAVLQDREGNTPKMLIVSGLRALGGDPTLEVEERYEAAKRIAFANIKNRQMVEAAIWSQKSQSVDNRTKLAMAILQTPNVGPDVCTGAVETLQGKVVGNLLLRLEALERSPNRELSDAARYTIQRGHPCSAGFLIAQIRANSAASLSGLRRGDIVTSIEGQEIASAHNWRHSLVNVEGAGKVTFAICRSGKNMKVELTITSRRHGIDGNFVSGK